MLTGLSFSSQRGPVTISAKELEFDYRSRTLTYRGDVVVSQGDLTLNSVATGGRAVFDQAARTVVLSQDAVLRQGPNEVAGDRVVVYLDEQRSVVEGGKQRVRAVLFPPKKDEESRAADAPAVHDEAALGGSQYEQ
jgi:lipopolysaccharide export system protein LptA